MYVFIMSNLESCWYLSPKRILPIGTAQQIGFHVISFNPCAVTFIVKALKQVLLKCEAKMKPEQIKRIAELSGGGFFQKRVVQFKILICIVFVL